jgi:invasion protein IalB
MGGDDGQRLGTTETNTGDRLGGTVLVKRYFALFCLVAGGLLMGSIESGQAQQQVAQQQVAAQQPSAQQLAQDQSQPDASVETSRFDNWTVRCVTAQQQSCQIFQQVTVKQGERNVPFMTISLDAERLRLQLPHGLSLREPVGLTAGGLKIEVPYSVCTQQACFAGQEATEQVIAAFQKGEQIEVTLARLQQDPIVFTVSLIGFSKAYAKMREGS